MYVDACGIDHPFLVWGEAGIEPGDVGISSQGVGNIAVAKVLIRFLD